MRAKYKDLLNHIIDYCNESSQHRYAQATGIDYDFEVIKRMAEKGLEMMKEEELEQKKRMKEFFKDKWPDLSWPHRFRDIEPLKPKIPRDYLFLKDSQ